LKIENKKENINIHYSPSHIRYRNELTHHSLSTHPSSQSRHLPPDEATLSREYHPEKIY